MVKRFTDTEIWKKEWYQNYSLKQKVLLRYLFDNCDCAGIFEPNYRMMTFIIGEQITKNDLLSLNVSKKQIEEIENGKFFIIDFCRFQYGELKKTCKPHLKVIETLKKFNLSERVSKGYRKGIDTLEEKEKEEEEEEEEEEEKEGEKPDKNGKDEKKKDPFINDTRTKFVEEYKKVFSQSPVLTRIDCDKIVELSTDIKDFDALIPIAIARLKKLSFKDINYKPCANWLLKDNNFARIINGEFEKKDETQNAENGQYSLYID